MRPASISDTNLVDALGEVVSRYGVEGASLVRLSEASGLKRASLYHRFPGGKDEIIEAIVTRTADRFGKVLAPAHAEGEPIDRATKVAAAISDYYGGGAKSCLIISLSVDDDGRRSAASGCVEAWSKAFEVIARDAGMSKTEAVNTAMDAVAAIEGALVISATSGDAGPFRRAIDSLPSRLVPKT